ncbi:EpsI family protein [Aquabacterium soli]|uniref:EpsI family protein n=1 Tax=Aquabacterium soli TaxID=2493092 RepID=A0A3R8S3Z2_9BURK|nr:exosortase-associated protein EpsI, B-type [Aquabacterium soli]RRR99921.1 EpsI family protein [Aquabacterium soli]
MVKQAFFKKAVALFFVFASTAIVAHQLGQKDPRRVVLPEASLESVIPQKFGEWRIDDKQPVVIANPEQQETLSKIYTDVLSRTYVNGQGQRVMLSLAYGANQSEGLQVHFPEVCYAAQGFAVGPVSDVDIRVADESVKVRHLTAKAGGRNEPITYWVVVGDQVANRGIDQKYVLLRYGAKLVTPDGLLVRVSSIGTNISDEYDLQERFLNDLFGAMSPGPRVRMLGASRT